MINLASCCTLPNANRLQNYALAAYSCSEGLAALGFWPGRQGTTSQQKLTAPHGDKASPYPIGLLPQGADLAVPPWSRAWGEWSFAGEPACIGLTGQKLPAAPKRSPMDLSIEAVPRPAHRYLIEALRMGEGA